MNTTPFLPIPSKWSRTKNISTFNILFPVLNVLATIFWQQQTPSKAYDNEKDFMLWGEKPSFFSVIKAGMFAVFFPHDLHMPNVMIEKALCKEGCY